MIYEKSCGAVVFTKTDRQIKYLLISNLHGVYGFPKGHMEGEETEEETALREVREETNVNITLIDGFRATDEYLLPAKKDTSKQVTYFLGTFQDQEIIFQKEELSGACLVNYEDALALLHYESAKKILKEANALLLRLGH